MQLPVVGVKALQPRGLSANIQDRGQAEEPERRRTGAPWRAQSCWCRGAGSLCQDDGGRAQRLRSASSKGPLGQEAQAEVADPYKRVLLLATSPIGLVERRQPLRRADARHPTVASLYSPSVSRELGLLQLRTTPRGPMVA